MSTEFSRALKAAVESNLKEPDTFWNPTQLDWRCRISVTVGDAPEDLKCIPQLPENIIDKLCSFRDMCNNTMAKKKSKTKPILGFYGGTLASGKRTLFPVGGGSNLYAVEFTKDAVFFVDEYGRRPSGCKPAVYAEHVKRGEWKRFPSNPFK